MLKPGQYSVEAGSMTRVCLFQRSCRCTCATSWASPKMALPSSTTHSPCSPTSSRSSAPWLQTDGWGGLGKIKNPGFYQFVVINQHVPTLNERTGVPGKIACTAVCVNAGISSTHSVSCASDYRLALVHWINCRLYMNIKYKNYLTKL